MSNATTTVAFILPRHLMPENHQIAIICNHQPFDQHTGRVWRRHNIKAEQTIGTLRLQLEIDSKVTPIIILMTAMKIMKVVFPLPSYKSSVGGCSHDKFLVQEVHEQHPALFHRGRCKGPRLHIAQVTFSKLFLADTFLMQICFKYLLQIFSSNSFSSLSFTRGPLSSNFFLGSLSFRFSPKGLKGSAQPAQEWVLEYYS